MLSPGHFLYFCKYMRRIRTIMNFSLTLIFIITVSGFNYTRNICLDSGNIDISLGSDQHQSQNADGINCIEDADCCVHQTKYLKTCSDFTASLRTKNSKTEIPLFFAAVSPAIVSVDFQILRKKVHPPPDIFTSADLLIQHGILLI